MFRRSDGASTHRVPEELAVDDFEFDVESLQEFDALKRLIESFEYQHPAIFETKLDQIKKILQVKGDVIDLKDGSGHVERQGKTITLLARLFVAVLLFVGIVIILAGFNIGGFRLPSKFFDQLGYALIIATAGLLLLAIGAIFAARSASGIIGTIKALLGRKRAD